MAHFGMRQSALKKILGAESIISEPEERMVAPEVGNVILFEFNKIWLVYVPPILMYIGCALNGNDP